jgi:hypothetical protein
MFEWHASGERNGVLIKARFFDGDQVGALNDVVERTLCFLPGTPARLLWREQDRRNLRWGRIVAQSDAVYQLGSGLVHMEFKERSKRSLDKTRWLGEVSTKDMLQCLIAAVTVAQTQNAICAAVLRYHNVGLLLVPQQRLLDLVLGMVDAACAYYGKPDVASLELADYAEARVRRAFPWRDEARLRDGIKAHEQMFR